MRMVTPPEAASKILSMPLWERSVSVQVLPVHGPGEEMVLFEEGQEEEAVNAAGKTKLTAYFDLCAADPSLGLRYSDVPSWYMWEKDPESGLKGGGPRGIKPKPLVDLRTPLLRRTRRGTTSASSSS